MNSSPYLLHVPHPWGPACTCYCGCGVGHGVAELSAPFPAVLLRVTRPCGGLVASSPSFTLRSSWFPFHSAAQGPCLSAHWVCQAPPPAEELCGQGPRATCWWLGPDKAQRRKSCPHLVQDHTFLTSAFVFKSLTPTGQSGAQPQRASVHLSPRYTNWQHLPFPSSLLPVTYAHMSHVHMRVGAHMPPVLWKWASTSMPEHSVPSTRISSLSTLTISS